METAKNLSWTVGIPVPRSELEIQSEVSYWAGFLSPCKEELASRGVCFEECPLYALSLRFKNSDSTMLPGKREEFLTAHVEPHEQRDSIITLLQVLRSYPLKECWLNPINIKHLLSASF